MSQIVRRATLLFRGKAHFPEVQVGGPTLRLPGVRGGTGRPPCSVTPQSGPDKVSKLESQPRCASFAVTRESPAVLPAPTPPYSVKHLLRLWDSIAPSLKLGVLRRLLKLTAQVSTVRTLTLITRASVKGVSWSVSANYSIIKFRRQRRQSICRGAPIPVRPQFDLSSMNSALGT